MSEEPITVNDPTEPNPLAPCYRFPDEATAISALSEYRGTDENGDAIWLTDSPRHALAVIGTLYDVDLTDPENPVSTPLEGYHVDLSVRDAADLPDSAAPYVIYPTNRRHSFL